MAREVWQAKALVAAVSIVSAIGCLFTRRLQRIEDDKPIEFDLGQEELEATAAAKLDDPGPRRLRKAETVLQQRTSRLILVLEATYDLGNQAAVLRTADCLGIQHVWIVADGVRATKKSRKDREKERSRATELAELREQVRRDAGVEPEAASTEDADSAKGLSTAIAKSVEWLTVRQFATSAECIQALLQEGFSLWVTTLSQDAKRLDWKRRCDLGSTERVALVFGREAEGVSSEMLAAADHKVYFPQRGFCESMNLSVAAALVTQRVLDLYPELGAPYEQAMCDAERTTLRERWFLNLAKRPDQQRSYLEWIRHPPRPYDDLRRPEHLRETQDMLVPKKRLR